MDRRLKHNPLSPRSVWLKCLSTPPFLGILSPSRRCGLFDLHDVQRRRFLKRLSQRWGQPIYHSLPRLNQVLRAHSSAQQLTCLTSLARRRVPHRTQQCVRACWRARVARHEFVSGYQSCSVRCAAELIEASLDWFVGGELPCKQLLEQRRGRHIPEA